MFAVVKHIETLFILHTALSSTTVLQNAKLVYHTREKNSFMKEAFQKTIMKKMIMLILQIQHKQNGKLHGKKKIKDNSEKKDAKKNSFFKKKDS